MEKQLQELILDTDFLYLQQCQKNTHFFDIIKTNEMTHSSMLSWLLNPYEGHNQSDFFIRNFLISLIGKNTCKLTLSDIESLNFQNISIELEKVIHNKARIDILIYLPEPNYLFVIENKFGSALHGDQLEAYEEWVENELSKKTTTFLVLIDGDEKVEADDENLKEWSVIDYDWLIKSLKSLLNRGVLSKDNEKIIKDYYIELSGDYAVDTKFTKYEKCLSSLSKKYSALIEKIKKDIGRITQNKYQYLRETLEVETSVSKTIRKFQVIFEELVEFSKVDDLESLIEKEFPNKFDFDARKNKLYIFPSKWEFLCKDVDGYWPIYFSFEDDEDSYILKLIIREKCFNETLIKINLIEEILNKYQAKSNIRSITLEKSIVQDDSKLLIDELKKHLNIVNKDVEALRK